MISCYWGLRAGSDTVSVVTVKGFLGTLLAACDHRAVSQYFLYVNCSKSGFRCDVAFCHSHLALYILEVGTGFCATVQLNPSGKSTVARRFVATFEAIVVSIINRFAVFA
jgi:hypothetical protein